MKVLVFFGGPSEERDVSVGSIKPWVTYLQADPTAEVTVVFIDRELRAYRPARRSTTTPTPAPTSSPSSGPSTSSSTGMIWRTWPGATT